jgi:hypothetical protein
MTSRLMLFRAVLQRRVPREIMESIQESFETPRKIPNIPRSILDFFCRAVGSAQVIPLCYQLPLCFIFVFVCRGSSGCEKLF